MISSVLQLLGGGALIGISVYYWFAENTVNFYVFLIVGIVFVIMPLFYFYRTFFKKPPDKKDDDKPHKGFL